MRIPQVVYHNGIKGNKTNTPKTKQTTNLRQIADTKSRQVLTKSGNICGHIHINGAKQWKKSREIDPVSKSRSRMILISY